MRLFKRKQAAPPWRTGPNSIFTRASTAMLNGVQFASGVPRIDGGKILIEEGTTNLLPAGAEDFSSWPIGGGSPTITRTPYPVFIPGLGNVVATRVQSTGGNTVFKLYRATPATLSNPHTSTVSVWAMRLSGTASMSHTLLPTAVSLSDTMQRIVITKTVNLAQSQIEFNAATATSDMDIVVYAPQIENKPYATSYTPPGTTRAAESLAIPVGATQKNLLTQNQATGGDTLGDTTGFIATSGVTISRDTTEKWNGTGSIKVVTPGNIINEAVTIGYPFYPIGGKIYTYSVWLKGAVGGEVVRLSGSSVFSYAEGPLITLSTTWTRYQFLLVAASSSASEVYVKTASSPQMVTFFVDGVQLEEGTTASDWALPEVDYSNAVLNPSAGTIEFDYTPTDNDASIVKYLFSMGASGTNYLVIRTEATNKYFTVYHYSSAGLVYIPTTIAAAAGVKKLHKLRWSGTTLTYYIDGVLVGSTTYSNTILLGTNAYAGTKYDGTTPRNGTISNLRISKIARTDTEMAYTGKLVADEYTTFFRKYWR